MASILAFPKLSVREKKRRLLRENGSLKQSERVGLLGDLLIQGKSNRAAFLEASRGMKDVYKQIAIMTARFPLPFLVELFSKPAIPFKEGVDWKRYLWGAAWRGYYEWRVRQVEKEHMERKMSEEPISFIRRYISSSEKWRKVD